MRNIAVTVVPPDRINKQPVSRYLNPEHIVQVVQTDKGTRIQIGFEWILVEISPESLFEMIARA